MSAGNCSRVLEEPSKKNVSFFYVVPTAELVSDFSIGFINLYWKPIDAKIVKIARKI